MPRITDRRSYGNGMGARPGTETDPARVSGAGTDVGKKSP